MKKQILRMESMHFYFRDYGEYNGQYTGTIEFKGKQGKIEVICDPKLSNKLLKACEENIRSLVDDAGKQFETAIKNSLEDLKT